MFPHYIVLSLCLAVAPGFINLMSWANESLIEDGLSQSDIRQGFTLEVMGEGDSMGPLNAAMKADMIRRQGDIQYDIEWTTLDEYLVYLEQRGITPNVASFIGAGISDNCFRASSGLCGARTSAGSNSQARALDDEGR